MCDLSADLFQADDIAAQMSRKLSEMQAMLALGAAGNKMIPIGRGLYMAVFHPEGCRH